MKILSVDWDYFFPDLAWMDWGHNESTLHFGFLWQLRCADFNLQTKQSALDYVQPDTELLKDFWQRVLAPDCHPEVLVTESHLDLALHVTCKQAALGDDWLSRNENLIIDKIDNFDQHHDCGYVDELKVVDCSNWASYLASVGKLKTYRLHYPAWRKKTPERGRQELLRRMKNFGRYDHELPKEPSEYDFVFICRSGGWTPPWCDNQFAEFVISLYSHCKVGRYEARFAGKENDLGVPVGQRHPTMAEALVMREEMLKQRQAMMANQLSDNMALSSFPITSRHKK